MTLKTVPVTGTLFNPNGSPAANASVVATLTAVDTDGGLVVPSQVTTNADSNGVFTMNLWPNSRGVNGSQYRLRAQMPGALPGVLLVNLLITVPDSDPAVPVPISTITNRTGPAALSDAKAAMLAAQAFAVQAQAAGADAAVVHADRLAADASAAAAVVSVGQAAANAMAAAGSATAAQAAARIFANTAAGIAGTTSGQYFYVVSASGINTLELWLNSAGAASDTGKRFPASRFVMNSSWGLAATRRGGWYSPGATDGILVLGDSFTRGVGATNPETGGWPALLDAQLKTLFGDGGSGFYGFPISGVTMSANFGKVTFAGSWSSTGGGPGGPVAYATAPGATASLTVTGDTLLVLYNEGNNSGPFTVSVDGGTAVSYGRSVGAQAGIIASPVARIPLGSTGSHTILLTNTTGYLYLEGFAAVNSAGGPTIYRMGADGAVADFWSRRFNGVTPTPENMNFIDQLQPRLTVIELGINDWNFQTALATYSANVEAIIQRALPYGVVMLVNSVNFSSTVQPITQAQYNDELRKLAIKYDCGYLDMNARWGAFQAGVLNGFQTSLANGHPSDAGHVDFANAVYYAVTGIPEVPVVPDAAALATAYQTRVVADGGTVTSLLSVKAAFEFAITNKITTTARYSPEWGVKKDGSNNVSKYYALEGAAYDLAQATGANQPLWVAAAQNSYPAIRFNGTTHYLKSGAFTLNQPATFCAAIKPITWSNTDFLWDGFVNGSGALKQSGVTPNVQLNAGAAANDNTNLPVGAWSYVREFLNGSSSELQIGAGLISTGDPAGTNPGGFTLGSAGAGTNCGNEDAGEVWLIPIPPTTAQKDALYAYFRRKWGTS